MKLYKIKKSNIDKKGLYASKDINSGARIINYKGKLITNTEVKQNPPSRSAKLRYAVKKYEFYNFETDILNKFKYLIDIENYSKKL